MNAFHETSNYSYSRNEKVEYLFSDLTYTYLVELIVTVFDTFSYCPWIFSLIASILVGLSGVFPLLVIPIEEGENLKIGAGANRLRVLLSFAVGGLLGDVFLHLLPEAWEQGIHKSNGSCSGIWVLVGMLIFITVEKLSSSLGSDNKIDVLMESSSWEKTEEEEESGEMRKYREEEKKLESIGNGSSSNSNNNNNTSKGNSISTSSKTAIRTEENVSKGKEHYHISGYLNLMANSVDNFTHGLAIGGSFSISFKMGVLSTFAILIHELPHEIGDFAILLKSGFSRWDAARAQICTATAGIMGSMFAVVYGSADGLESKTSWILPFTAGGFLHIALVTVLPELVNEESKTESCKQLGSLVFGIGVMGFMINFFE